MVELMKSYKVENFIFNELSQAEKYEELINKYDFNQNQKEKIYEGLKDNLNVDWYAKPEFDSSQMFWIYKGLKNNNPFVRFYAKPKYNSIQMQRFYYDDSVDFEFRMFKKNLINFEYKFIKEYEYNKQKYNKFDRIGYFND
jgi:hypothetical protein